MDIIFTCGCGDTDSFAKDAFKILFPNRIFPELTSQKPRNREFAKWDKYFSALNGSKDKFAFYATETELWDLLKGVQVA